MNDYQSSREPSCEYAGVTGQREGDVGCDGYHQAVTERRLNRSVRLRPLPDRTTDDLDESVGESGRGEGAESLEMVAADESKQREEGDRVSP